MLNITRYFLFLLLLIIFIRLSPIEKQYANKQNQWSPEEISQANTGINCGFLSDNERLTVQYCNLVRLFPQKFIEVELKPYLISSEISKNGYSESLISDLKKMKSINVLKVDSILFEKAKAYAIVSGEKGQVGHFNFANRMKGYLLAGENCDYGHNQAKDIIMSLLIDDGVSNLGHRKNLLNENFAFIGLSIQLHKKYNYVCVMDFVGKELNPKPTSKAKRKRLLRF